jgi:hypothetical protein
MYYTFDNCKINHLQNRITKFNYICYISFKVSLHTENRREDYCVLTVNTVDVKVNYEVAMTFF